MRVCAHYLGKFALARAAGDFHLLSDRDTHAHIHSLADDNPAANENIHPDPHAAPHRHINPNAVVCQHQTRSDH